MQRRPLDLFIDPHAPVMSEIRSRCIPNEQLTGPLPGKLDEAGTGLSVQCLAELQKLEDQALSQVRDGGRVANCDESVYVGGPGVAYMLLKAAVVRGEPELLEDASLFLDPWSERVDGLGKRQPGLHCSLLCGKAGWLCVDALRKHASGDAAGAAGAAAAYVELINIARCPLLDADEWLYGRAGYLQGLLVLRAVLGEAAVSTELLDTIAEVLLENGQRCAERMQAGWPLMWSWHGRFYLGAAHGVAGILFMLLHVDSAVSNPRWRSLIVGTLQQLASLRTESGSWPSKCGEQSDGLVHFCHGASGFVWLFCKAHAVLGEEWLLDEAKRAGETVWRFGLLRKGPGLCHGIAGNGYALLALFRSTGDTSWLLRAHFFALKMLDPDIVRMCRKPDNPLSLFEGLAGSVCFLLDLRSNPSGATFPFFDVGGLASHSGSPSARQEPPSKGARHSE